MKADQYIKDRQQQWALRRRLPLVGSQGKRGEPRYTSTLNENLFEPISDRVQGQFTAGDGGELGGKNGYPGKMQAVHSSSALGVNVFHYWQRIGDIPTITELCGLPVRGVQELEFESNRCPICSKFRYAPNLDVVLRYAEGASQSVVGIECKFAEAYGARGHQGLDPKYLVGAELEELWRDIPHLQDFAKTITPNDILVHLHPAQLLKHILALKRAYGTGGFRLLYLWYDALGKEGAQHRREVEAFTVVAKADGVMFSSLTYQELILGMKQIQNRHGGYVDYLTERYL